MLNLELGLLIVVSPTPAIIITIKQKLLSLWVKYLI